MRNVINGTARYVSIASLDITRNLTKNRSTIIYEYFSDHMSSYHCVIIR